MERRHRKGNHDAERVCNRGKRWDQKPIDQHLGTYSNRQSGFSQKQKYSQTASHNWISEDSPPHHGQHIHSGLFHRQRRVPSYQDQSHLPFQTYQSSTSFLIDQNPGSHTGPAALIGENSQISDVSQFRQQPPQVDQSQGQARGMGKTSVSSNSALTPTTPPPNELRLLLAGRKGAGKSATGNTILGGKYFRSHLSTSSVTKTCERARATVRGRNLLVVDTPGFSNALLSQDAMWQEVQKSHELCSPGPHAVLLIIPLGRFTEEESQGVDTVQQLFSDEVPSRTILVFTYTDMLKGDSIQDFIFKQNQSIQELVERFDYRFLAFNNRDPGDRSQVDQLLEMVDNLRIQGMRLLPRPLRLVLVGKTGTGKSATGNTILGRECFRSEISMSSVTEVCQSVNATVQGRDLVLIDTPGLFDTSLAAEVVQREMIRCIMLCSPGPHALLLTIRLGGSNEEDWHSIDLIEEIFQVEVRRYIILIFTHADLLEGTSIQDIIRQDLRLQELVERFDGRYMAFNNMDLEDCTQVTQLLERVDSLLVCNENEFFTNRFTQEIEGAVSELLLEAGTKGEGSGGRFQNFYKWCQSHPYVTLAVGAGAGLAVGGPLVLGAMTPAVAKVGLGAQLTNLITAFCMENIAIEAIVMKLTAKGLLGSAGTTGAAGAIGAVISVATKCCIQ